MKLNNPLVIARNYKVEEALNFVTNDNNYDKFNDLLNAIKDPYKKDLNTKDFQKPPTLLFENQYKTYCGT